MELKFTFLFLFPFGTFSISVDDLLPFGDDERDTELITNSVHVHLPKDVSVHYYSQSYNSLWVNANGVISFDKPFPFYDPQIIIGSSTQSTPLIAAFYADIDKMFNCGKIYYRYVDQYLDPELIDMLDQKIEKYFGSPFHPHTLIIVTWAFVCHSDSSPLDALLGNTNTFQVVLANKERETTAIFLYPDGEMNWMRGDKKDMYPQVGFETGEDSLDCEGYQLASSGTPDVNFILTNFNNVVSNEPGAWGFKTGSIGANSIKEPIPVPPIEYYHAEYEEEDFDGGIYLDFYQYQF